MKSSVMRRRGHRPYVHLLRLRRELLVERIDEGLVHAGRLAVLAEAGARLAGGRAHRIAGLADAPLKCVSRYLLRMVAARLEAASQPSPCVPSVEPYAVAALANVEQLVRYQGDALTAAGVELPLPKVDAKPERDRSGTPEDVEGQPVVEAHAVQIDRWIHAQEERPQALASLDPSHYARRSRASGLI